MITSLIASRALLQPFYHTRNPSDRALASLQGSREVSEGRSWDRPELTEGAWARLLLPRRVCAQYIVWVRRHADDPQSRRHIWGR